MAEAAEKPKAKKKATTTKTTTKTGAKTAAKAKPRAKKPAAEGPKLTLNEKITQQILARIEGGWLLPWQKPFVQACMNWATCKEYQGINKLLLEGGEYITYVQLQKVNEQREKKELPKFYIKKGTKSEMVVYRSMKEKEITAAEAAKIERTAWRWVEQHNGVYTLKESVMTSANVFNIMHIATMAGEPLPSKIGVTVFENFTAADDIVNPYVKNMGITLKRSGDGAYHMRSENAVYMPPPEHFKSSESYYRVLFHELVHSTGVQGRLNRDSLLDYHKANSIRSKEELVAEVGALLLASEAGFREDCEEVENSYTYVASWMEWMKDHPNELVKGMREAERAKQFILSAGLVTTEQFSSATGVAPEQGFEGNRDEDGNK